MSVTAVVVVIVILLVLNSRPSHPDAGPAVVSPPTATPTGSLTATPTRSSPRPTPARSSPAAHSSTVASPVAQPPMTQPPVTRPPAATRPAVTVLNNSRRPGLAARVADEVRARGWPIRQTGNFRGRVAVTTAYYAPGQRGAAEQLARAFGQVQRVAPRFAGLPGSGLTLVVTRTWSG